MSAAGLAATLLDALPGGAAVLDAQLRFCAVNGRAAELSGLPAAQHIGRRLDEVLPARLARPSGLLAERVLASGAPVLDLRVSGATAARPDEERDWRLCGHPVRDAGPRPIGVLLTVHGPGTAPETPAPLRLQDGEMPLPQVIDNLFIYVGVLAPDGTLLHANRTPLEAAGLTLQEVRGRKFWDCPWWRHDAAVRDWVRERVARAAEGESVRADVTACLAGGRIATLDFMLAPLRDAHGRITHLLPSAMEISDRKHSEEALRSSEVLFRSVVESAPNGLVMVDAQGTMTLLNTKMERLFGYTREEMLGHSIDMLLPEPLRALHVRHRAGYARAPTAREMVAPGRRELHGLRKDGSEFPVEIGLMPVDTPEGPQTIAAVVDVSMHKEAERALERALREKTALLDEVHHRVKNNLQVISSLLSLQARTAAPEAREVLADSQARVKAMALTHQLLYERQDFSNVHMGPYLRRLMQLMRQSYAHDRRDIEVAVDVAEDGLQLDLQRALPCALLVTELVINAFKHAFPPPRGGRLTVSLAREGAHGAVIEVADDGVGVPPSVEPGAGASLGFQLLPLLADQLGAQLALHRDHGSRFTIRFALDETAGEAP